MVDVAMGNARAHENTHSLPSVLTPMYARTHTYTGREGEDERGKGREQGGGRYRCVESGTHKQVHEAEDGLGGPGEIHDRLRTRAGKKNRIENQSDKRTNPTDGRTDRLN